MLNEKTNKQNGASQPHLAMQNNYRPISFDNYHLNLAKKEGYNYQVN